MAFTEDRSDALSSIIFTLFIEYFLKEINWLLLRGNDCPPKRKIPVELKQDESKHDSSQQKNAKIG